MGKNTRNMNSKYKFLFKILICLTLLFIVFFIAQEKINFFVVFAKDEKMEQNHTNEENKETNANNNLNVIPDVDYYDQIIKTKYDNIDLANSEYELIILQRELVNNAGNNVINHFINESEENKNTFEWLFNNVDVLRMYITGGEPTGSYIQSFKVLNELYINYKEDLKDNTISKLGNRYGDIYQKMMVTLSLTHSRTVRFWISDHIVKEDGIITNNADNDSKNISNAVVRYAVYKKMFLAGKLDNRIFEQLEVEEMRYVMFTELSDYEIEWLRDYTEKNESNAPYKYVKYNLVGSYWIPEFYIEENKEKWEKKYDLTGYGIDYKSYYPHLWMVFELGGVCWQISNSGQNITASYGIPSVTVGQPGHLAFMNYTLDNSGNVKWKLTNDSKGWTKTNNTVYTNTDSYHQMRMMNNWGAGDYASEDNGSYILLSQAAINNFQKYQSSQELVMLANTYSSDLVKKEEIYRKALEIQNINLDAWLGLINTYKANGSKTANDYYNLAREITENLKLYPLPMYDMLKLISNEVEVQEYKASFIMLQTNALNKSLQTNDTQNIQADVVKTMASYLLENIDSKIAVFSFSGEEAGILKLGKIYENTTILWEYSLDGGKTWIETNEHSIKLTNEQIHSISASTDIKVHIVGVPRDEENIFVIDITDEDIGKLDIDGIGDKVYVFYSEKYNIQNGFILGIRAKMQEKTGTTVGEFKKDIVSSEDLIFLDKSGKSLNDDDFICTGDILKVGQDFEYVLVANGDIDGDGEVTINDIAKLKMYFLSGELLPKDNLMFFDVDGDCEITINDIAKIKLMVIGLY